MTDAPNLITSQGLESLRAALETLEGEGRREIAERIKTAREWGDLKENSEYHDAKNDQAHLETKIVLLRERLARAKVVEAEAGGAIVGLGSVVHVRDGDGREQRFQIVSSHAAVPAEGKISIESPVARGLLGLAPGAQATVTLPKGSRSYSVLSIE